MERGVRHQHSLSSLGDAAVPQDPPPPAMGAPGLVGAPGLSPGQSPRVCGATRAPPFAPLSSDGASQSWPHGSAPSSPLPLHHPHSQPATLAPAPPVSGQPGGAAASGAFGRADTERDSHAENLAATAVHAEPAGVGYAVVPEGDGDHAPNPEGGSYLADPEGGGATLDSEGGSHAAEAPADAYAGDPGGDGYAVDPEGAAAMGAGDGSWDAAADPAAEAAAGVASDAAAAEPAQEYTVCI